MCDRGAPEFRRSRPWRCWLIVPAAYAASVQAATSPASPGTALSEGHRGPPAHVVSLADVVEARTVDSLSISPDRQWLAFRVLSPSIAANARTEQWFVVRADGRRPPVPLGQSHPVMFEPLFDLVADGVSLWSRDSRSIYVLEQRRSAIIVARLGRHGLDRAITHDAADVVDFAPSPDRDGLTYHVRADRREIAAAQGREDAEGLHFDTTVYADGLRLTRSFRIGDRMLSVRDHGDIYPSQAYAGGLRVKSVRLDMIPSERPDPTRSSTINPYQQVVFDRGPLGTVLLADGTSLHLDRLAGGGGDATAERYRLGATFRDGRMVDCQAAACTGSSIELRQVLPGRDGEAVLLSEAERVPRTKILGWTPSTGRIRTIFDTGTSLGGGSMATGAGCVSSLQAVFCVEASATAPAHLVAIDLVSGRSRVLADPNARLRRARYPIVRPMTWRDPAGRPATGILVLPAVPAPRLPLVITTYSCRGYLHGGMASLTPEFGLAEHGIAALCVNLDPTLPSAHDAKGQEVPLGLDRAEIDVYEAAIETLAKADIIDRNKVGISGHSFSAMVIAYAISHGHRFKAASLGTGVLTDPVSFYVRAPLPGTEGRTAIGVNGLPPADDDPDHVWSDVSAALNAKRIDAAILLQPPENEWLDALQLLTTVRDAKGAADMYVYPDAGHLLARYPMQQYKRAERSIDWFRFWLLDSDPSALSDPHPAWDALRKEQAARQAR